MLQEGHFTSGVLSQNPGPQSNHDKNVKQLEGHSIKSLSSLSQNGQSHKQQEETKKL